MIFSYYFPPKKSVQMLDIEGGITDKKTKRWAFNVTKLGEMSIQYAGRKVESNVDFPAYSRTRH